MEADRLSIYLMARAAYAPDKAVDFWKRLYRAVPAFGGDPTHPRLVDRLRSMQQEHDRITATGVPARDVLPPADLARKLR
jgi:predicted Zn-dependent protease